MRTCTSSSRLSWPTSTDVESRDVAVGVQAGLLTDVPSVLFALIAFPFARLIMILLFSVLTALVTIIHLYLYHPFLPRIARPLFTNRDDCSK